MKLGLFSVFSLGLFLGGSAVAQEFSPFSFSVGGGFTQPVGNTGRNLQEGWNAGGSAGYNFAPWVGVNVDLEYNRFGITSNALSNLGFTSGGNVHIFSATLDPIVHLTPKRHFDIYATGGGGVFHVDQNFNGVGLGLVASNPFFGVLPTGAPVNSLLGNYSVNKPGLDAGMGIAFGTKWHGKFFAEAKYNRVFMSYGHVDYVPVTFGFRW